MDQWLTAWQQWRMPGVWDLAYLEVNGQEFWDRNCSAKTGWRCGLRVGWQAHLAPALTALRPHVAAGALRAVFLGDEMMLAGISASNVTAAADFVRASLGSGGLSNRHTIPVVETKCPPHAPTT
jgi:hypothetical protein